MSQRSSPTENTPVTLFHFPDAICAQKVRLALAEKRVKWKSKIVQGADLRSPEFLEINPLGVVPVLLHDGFVAVESRIISEYIEDSFSGPALLPSGSKEKYRARYWTKQIDDSLHLNIFALSFLLYMREKYLRLPEETLAVALPGLTNPVKRKYCESLMKDNFDSPIVSQSIDQFWILAKSLDEALAYSPWIVGYDYSLADADLTPYFYRLERLGLFSLWDDKPNLSDWISRCRSRKSFQTAILDWMTNEDAEQIEFKKQLGQERFAPLIHALS